MKKSDFWCGVGFVLIGLACGLAALRWDTPLGSLLCGFSFALLAPGVLMIWKYRKWSRPENAAAYQDKLEQEQAVIHSLAASLQVMAAEQKHQTEALRSMREDVSRLDGKVDALEMKPARRWDGLVDKLVWGVAGGVLTWLLARAGF